MAWPAAEMSFPAPAVVWQAANSISSAKPIAVILERLQALKLYMGRSFGQVMALPNPPRPGSGAIEIEVTVECSIGQILGGRV